MKCEIISKRSIAKRILIYLNTNPINRNYGIAISREVDIPTSYVSLALKYFESIGLIYSKRGEKVKGSWKKNVFLTEKGKKVTKLLIELEELTKPVTTP